DGRRAHRDEHQPGPGTRRHADDPVQDAGDFARGGGERRAAEMAMSPWRPVGIRGMLPLALFVAALLAFAMATGAILLFERFTLEDRARSVVQPYAELVSVGAEAAVAFGDAARAQEILDTLRA